MKIEVLGTGCKKCQKLYQTVLDTLAEKGIDAEVAKVTDMDAIVKRGVMGLPALAVDGQVVVSGRVPSQKEIGVLLSK